MVPSADDSMLYSSYGGRNFDHFPYPFMGLSTTSPKPIFTTYPGFEQFPSFVQQCARHKTGPRLHVSRDVLLKWKGVPMCQYIKSCRIDRCPP